MAVDRIPMGVCRVHKCFTPCPQCVAEPKPLQTVTPENPLVQPVEFHSSESVSTGVTPELRSTTTDELFAMSVEARVVIIKEMISQGIDPEDHKSLEDPQGINQDAAETLAADRPLFEVYRDAFLEGKQEKIRQKTAVQIETLKQYFLDNKDSGSLDKMQKLEEFKTFVGSLVPMVADKNLAIEEFKSPRVQGLKARGDGFYDTMVQGGAYVYGSFDKFPHNMAGPKIGDVLKDPNFDFQAWKEKTNAGELDFNKITPEQARMRHQRRLDEEAIADHAQIVMCDVSEALPISHRFGVPEIKFYVDNTFDYRLGKELFVYLFASVFESPLEAQLFLSQTDDMRAEEWAKPEDDFFSLANREYKGIPQERVRAIVQESKKICRQFGITLPMQVEVRVRDNAKIQPGW